MLHNLTVEASYLSTDICIMFLFRWTNHTRPSPILWANLPFSTIAIRTSYYLITAHVGNTGRRLRYAGSWKNTSPSRRLTRVSAVASANLIWLLVWCTSDPKRACLKACFGFEWRYILIIRNGVHGVRDHWRYALAILDLIKALVSVTCGFPFVILCLELVIRQGQQREAQLSPLTSSSGIRPRRVKLKWLYSPLLNTSLFVNHKSAFWFFYVHAISSNWK